jgi:F0F1-type ATP synthase epsilon subunit
MNQLTLTIQTPEVIVFQGPIQSVLLVNETGQMEIFPNHATLAGSILFSHTIVRVAPGQEEEFVMRNGLVLMNNETSEVKLLVEYCHKIADINFESIHEYRMFIEEKLKNKEALNSFQVVYLEEQQASLKKMIEVIGKK